MEIDSLGGYVKHGGATAPTNESTSAVETLKSLRYTYHGGERWKPPLGTPRPPHHEFQAAYWKACESSQPRDWMSAALAAQRVLKTSIPATVKEALSAPPQDDEERDDPCPGCVRGAVCRTPACGRLKLPLDHPYRTTPPAVNAPTCECNQGQVCGVCDPITRTV